MTRDFNAADGVDDFEEVGEFRRAVTIWENLYASVERIQPVIRAFENHPPTENTTSNLKHPLEDTTAELNLDVRDANAVQYSKSLLQDGDTLVFINFPNGVKAYDKFGFEIATRHIVHSKNLLATGSSYFKGKLTDWESHKTQRKYKLIGNAPPGIKFFLDLTPPEEGDEALNLTAALSCPEGFLRWHTAKQRLGVSEALIGGMDETASAPPPLGHSKQGSHAKAVAAMINGVESPADSVQPTVSTRKEAIDYDPIRHRTGIERILQIIEGKFLRLDSAPKVWTLAALAEYFDCRASVMDYVFTWVWAYPNCRIIEILPESILRLGTMLQSPRLIQTSFSVLVSEEAFDIGTKVYHPCPKNSRTFGRNETKFGRIIESLDEDNANMVEYAGVAFAGRINQVLRNLCDPDMKWLWALNSTSTLKAFTEHLEAHGADDIMTTVAELKHKLNHYVRGRLLWCYVAQLQEHQDNRAREHRQKEAWKGSAAEDYAYVYDDLGGKEKIITRYFWEIMRDLEWGVQHSSNMIRDTTAYDHPLSHAQEEVADAHEVEKVAMMTLLKLTTDINAQVLEEVKSRRYNDGQSLRQNPDDDSVTTVIHKAQHDQMNSEDDDVSSAWPEGLPFFNTSTTSSNADNYLSSIQVWAGSDSRQPAHADLIPEHSVYFSLVEFFQDVDRYVTAVCAQMLSPGDNDWSTLCDTLLCVGEEEYKFLPLYAGGLNDGSGGVFADPIPAAEKGPTGPGPAFNTGDTIYSRASSSAEWDSMSDAYTETVEGVNSSLGVEDGHSDYLPRGVVVSEDDFPLDRGANAMNFAFRTSSVIGKGKEVERATGVENVKKETGDPEMDHIMSDNFLDDPIYEYDSDDDDEDHEGNITE